MPLSREPAKLSQVCLCFLQTVFSYNTGSQETCANNRHQCSVHAECRDYATGFCCRCVANYTGNGRQCVAEGNVLFLCIFSFGEKEKECLLGLGACLETWPLPRSLEYAVLYAVCNDIISVTFSDDHSSQDVLFVFWCGI